MSEVKSLEEQQHLYLTPLPKDVGFVQCTIKRDDAGFNKFSPKYYLKLHKDNKVILMCEGALQSATKNYKITIKSRRATQANKKDSTYLGKVRAEAGNTHWFIFDDGYNEADMKPVEVKKAIDSGKKARAQYGTVKFQGSRRTTLMGGNQNPHQFSLYVPKVTSENSNAVSWKEGLETKANISETYSGHKKAGSESNIQKMKCTDSVDLLKFDERLTIPSRKNFQITADGSRVCLQFGRAGDANFNMDVSYPLSIF